jgi:hypothetical protein
MNALEQNKIFEVPMSGIFDFSSCEGKISEHLWTDATSWTRNDRQQQMPVMINVMLILCSKCTEPTAYTKQQFF